MDIEVGKQTYQESSVHSYSIVLIVLNLCGLQSRRMVYSAFKENWSSGLPNLKNCHMKIMVKDNKMQKLMRNTVTNGRSFVHPQDK